MGSIGPFIAGGVAVLLFITSQSLRAQNTWSTCYIPAAKTFGLIIAVAFLLCVQLFYPQAGNLTGYLTGYTSPKLSSSRLEQAWASLGGVSCSTTGTLRLKTKGKHANSMIGAKWQ